MTIALSGVDKSKEETTITMTLVLTISVLFILHIFTIFTISWFLDLFLYFPAGAKMCQICQNITICQDMTFHMPYTSLFPLYVHMQMGRLQKTGMGALSDA